MQIDLPQCGSKASRTVKDRPLFVGTPIAPHRGNLNEESQILLPSGQSCQFFKGKRPLIFRPFSFHIPLHEYYLTSITSANVQKSLTSKAFGVMPRSFNNHESVSTSLYPEDTYSALAASSPSLTCR